MAPARCAQVIPHVRRIGRIVTDVVQIDLCASLIASTHMHRGGLDAVVGLIARRH